MIFSSPPQCGQRSRSSSNTRLSRRAPLSRTGRWCAQFASHGAALRCPGHLVGPVRHPQRTHPGVGRQHAMEGDSDANAPLGTSAASRCMNSSGGVPWCVVPSRQAVFNLSTPWPAALHCTRSLANAGRVR